MKLNLPIKFALVGALGFFGLIGAAEAQQGYTITTAAQLLTFVNPTGIWPLLIIDLCAIAGAWAWVWNVNRNTSYFPHLP